ncbi:MAG: M23 family metallopeptidase [Deltaproteobacteria bacterium]|nr:MAG: M23 family metallopeptidase [Deltaproteobacteria bacterium]
MKRRTLTVILTPSGPLKKSVYSLSSVVLCVVVGVQLVSWLLVGMGGYLGTRFYHDYLQLREKTWNLRATTEELSVLRQTLTGIEESEQIMRNFLGLEGRLTEGGGPSRGGMAVNNPSAIDSRGVRVEGHTRTPAQFGIRSTLNQAQSLQTSLREMLETVHEKQRLLDSTPSIVPVLGERYWFSSGFGWRYNPFTGLKEFHYGLDISDLKGTPIIAPASGVVLSKGYEKYMGEYLRIDHGWGCVSTYGHLASVFANVGARVKRGQVIGTMGDSGKSTGPHLHYELAINNEPVNPLDYILNNKFAKRWQR